MAFSNGSTLVVPTADAPRFGDELGQYLSSLGITYFSTVPTMLATMAPSVLSLRTVVLSGEVCPPQLVSAWARPGLRILNVYGPDRGDRQHDGLRVPRRRAGHDRSADRRLHRPDRRRITPAAPDRRRGRADHRQRHPGARLLQRARADRRQVREHAGPVDRERGRARRCRCYRTGDLARVAGRRQPRVPRPGRRSGQDPWLPRGAVGDRGRTGRAPGQIRSASVSLLQREGLQELAAYVVTKHRHVKIDRHELFSLLESRVPPYMIPGFLDVIDELPRTTSGKVDRRALPQPVCPLVRVTEDAVRPEPRVSVSSPTSGPRFSASRTSRPPRTSSWTSAATRSSRHRP